MKYEIISTGKFKKDLKTLIKRGYNIQLLQDVVSLLAGNWTGHRECHITSDWLLIYKIDNDVLVLTLTRTGAHTDLF